MDKQVTVTIDGEEYNILKSQFQDGTTKIDLQGDDPTARYHISCSVEGVPLKPEYIYAKTWMENTMALNALLDQGLLESTGLDIPVSDYADALICKLLF